MEKKLTPSNLNLLTSELLSAITAYLSAHPMKIYSKDDRTPVTNLDHYISDWLKAREEFNHVRFFSEEDHDELIFPCVIVDPVDGTREFIQGRSEWSVSVAVAESSDFIRHPYQGFILNPLKNFLTTKGMTANDNRSPVVMVSRTEWEKNEHQKLSQHFKVEPCGSIAFKLGLLNEGQIGAVVSMRPKHIWDIAAGVGLLSQNGYEFWSENKKVTTLDKLIYKPPLFWCRPEDSKRFLDLLT
jgi:myo-inositol-1(or 4)-monophosphatase